MGMQMKKRLVFVMAFALMMQMLPLPEGMLVWAFDTSSRSAAAGELSGTIGTNGNITWKLTTEPQKDGWDLKDVTPYQLTLTGTGAMGDFSTELIPNSTDRRTAAPWKEYVGQIQTVSIGDGITSIGNNAFYGCVSVLSLEIPDSIISIGNYAFCSCTSLKEVIIPGTVETIGTYSFSTCKQLEEVTISEGVQSIEANAFGSCGALAWLELPEKSLTTLGSNCFSGTALESLNIPASVTTISQNPCVGGKLRTVTVASENKNYTVKNNMLIELQDSVANKVVCYPCKGSANAVVPASVKIIGAYAFSQAEIQSVDLPGSLQEIAEFAFSYASQLENIDVPGNVTQIGSSAFRNCSALADVKLGGDILSIGNYVFFNCQKITELTLPDKMTSIGNYAFSNCTGLKQIDFPNSITKLGSSVLANCSSLERASFGQEIETISGDVFNGCPKLAEIAISPKNPHMVAEDNVIYNSDKTTLIYYAAGLSNDKFVIPDTVTTVGGYAFTYCTYLEELRFPASVALLGTYAVYRNETLGKLLFYGDAPSVTEYGQNIGTSCYAYNLSVYGNKVKNGSYDNTGLVICRTEESTGWDKGWEKTGKYTQYESVSTYTWQANYIFSTWDPARSDVAEGVFGGLSWTYRDDIGEIIFSGEGKIPDFTQDNLPTWSTDDSDVDGHMQDIKLIELGTAAEVGDYAFYGAGKLIRILSEGNLERIGQDAFANCKNLKIVQIQSAARIEKEAFMGDTAITDEVDVRGAEEIAESVFNGCTAMTDILLGEKLVKIGAKAFSGCTALESLILPESLTSLGEGCFDGCAQLRTVNIPKGILEIPGNCFARCSNFQKIYFYGDCPTAWEEDSFQGVHNNFTIYFRAGNTTWDALGSSWNGIPVEGLETFYTEQEDHYSFANAAPSFGYGSEYSIPRQRYITAFQSIIRGSYYYAWDSGWQGSCFGMAASSTEFYQGDLFDVKDYDSAAETLYDVAAPGDSDAALTKLIEIYQVSQFVDLIGEETFNNSGKYRKLIKQVEEFERSGGLDVDSTADPIIMCIYANCVGHAVVPVTVNMDTEGNYILDVYDCNAPSGLQKLVIKKDFSGIDYVSGCITYKSASFVKYSTIQTALSEADFTGENLKRASDESDKVSVAVNREEVNLVNGGGKDYTEIKGAYEQKPMSNSTEDTFSGIRSFVLPQGEYKVQDTSKGDDQQEPLTYYVGTEDLFSEIETSDEDATLTVKSVKGVGYDVVTLSSENADTESELIFMDASGIQKEISVQGSEISLEVVDDSEVKLSVSEDASVEVDGKAIDLTDSQASISFYASEGVNPMNISDMSCNISLDKDGILSGKAGACVTWAKETAMADVDVTIKIKDEVGNVIAKYKTKTDLTLGTQQVNVKMDGIKAALDGLSGEFKAVCEMTLTDADGNTAYAVYSDITLNAPKADNPAASPEEADTSTASPGEMDTVPPLPGQTDIVPVLPEKTNTVPSLPEKTDALTVPPASSPKTTGTPTPVKTNDPAPTGTPTPVKTNDPVPTPKETEALSPTPKVTVAPVPIPEVTEKPSFSYDFVIRVSASPAPSSRVESPAETTGSASAGKTEEQMEITDTTDTTTGTTKSSLPGKGTIRTVGALKYVIKKSAKKNGTVLVSEAKNSNAKSVKIPKKVTIDGYTFKVVGISKNAFANAPKLSTVTIGANVTSIGANAFKNCKKLEFLIIPNKVTSIGTKAFAGCSTLRYLLVKSSKLKKVGDGAFLNINSKVEVKTSKSKQKKYTQMFMNEGAMPKNAVFIIDPVKLKYKGKSY